MDTNKILADLRSERNRIDRAIAAIEAIHADGVKPPSRTSGPSTPARRPRRHMSAAARRKMSAMMKARWAERKKKSA